MILLNRNIFVYFHYFFRASGGDPKYSGITGSRWLFFPRKRRWSPYSKWRIRYRCIFSAQAEVIPIFLMKYYQNIYFFRASGGDPRKYLPCLPTVQFFPRKRRWSYQVMGSGGYNLIFSAQAEVILVIRLKDDENNNFFRASGGDPSRYHKSRYFL